MAAPDTPRERPLTRGGIERLAEAEILTEASTRAALALWDESRAWRAFAARWLAVLGGAFLLAGILFFFAYNWRGLHRFARFAILEGGVLLTAIGAAWNSRPAAAVLTGVLIAVYGQAYQTGADAFQNFIGWAALILPWVLAGRSAPLWVLWLAVLETGVILYWTQVVGPTGATGFGALFLLLGLMTLAAASAREALARRPSFAWLAHRSLRYLLLAACLTWLGISTLRLVFSTDTVVFSTDHEDQTALDAIGFFLFGSLVALTFWWFHRSDYDLGALLLAALFSATLAVIALGRFVLEASDFGDAGSWIVMAACTLGIYDGAGFLLQGIHRAHKLSATE